MIYGKRNVFDADRLIDLLDAFETYSVNSKSSGGALLQAPTPPPPAQLPWPSSPFLNPISALSALFPPPLPPAAGVSAFQADALTMPTNLSPATVSGSRFVVDASVEQGGASRAALVFMLSEEGAFFREFFLDEIVRSIDALSRDQLRLLVHSLGWERVVVPVFLPAANKRTTPLAPEVTAEDAQQVDSVMKLLRFLAGGSGAGSVQSLLTGSNDLLPLLPRVAGEIVPQVATRLASRIGARFVREFYL